MSKKSIARFWFWPVYFLLLLAITLAGAEFISSFSVPSWPARELRPIPIDGLKVNVTKVFGDMSELVPLYNDWAVRDRPRSIARPPDVHFRSVLVGDSFLEGSFNTVTPSALIERRWAQQGRSDMEAINLGISATGPRQYYYRIKKFALQLRPDVIVVFVYAGNDFVTTRLDGFSIPALVDELPVPSILGAVAPRTTWLIANRLGLAEVGRANKEIPNEFKLLNDWAEEPSSAERLARVVGHMKNYYYPKLSEDTIREILLRGGGQLATAAAERPLDREYLAGWLLSGVIDWETGQWEIPRNAGGSRPHGGRFTGRRDAQLAGRRRTDRKGARHATDRRLGARRGRRSEPTPISGGYGQDTTPTRWPTTRVIDVWRARFASAACRSSTCAKTSTESAAPTA